MAASSWFCLFRDAPRAEATQTPVPYRRSLWVAATAVCLFTNCSDTSAPAIPVPAALLIVSGNQQVGTVGRELPELLVVHVVDKANEPVPGQVLNFRVTKGGGDIFAGVATTNDAGEARERWTLGTVAGELQEVQVRAVDTRTGEALLATFSAEAVADSAVQLQAATTDAQSTTVGTTVTTAPSVVVKDQHQNPVPGVPVTFGVASGGGVVDPTTPVLTDANGIAAVISWTLGTTVGANTLTATSAGLSGSPATFTATGTVPTLVFTDQPTETTARQVISPAIGVTIQDALGNLVGNATDAVTVVIGTSPNGGTLSGTTTVSAVGGLATFGDLRIDRAGGYTLKATSGTLTGAESAPFDIVVSFASVSAASVSAVVAHTCGLTTGGDAYCWGRNTHGQLGDDTEISKRIPTLVSGGLSFVSVSAGGSHNCGVATAGDAYCWGLGGTSQLGSGSITDRSTPVPVSGGLSFVSLSAGRGHTCGVATAGDAYCWGAGGLGQLGDGTTTDRWTPVPVSGGLSFASVSAGANHTCGVTTAGSAYCWGLNQFGQLGDGTTTDRWTPVPVSGGLSFASVSASYRHTCGVTTNDNAYCWGWNPTGELGDGTMTDRLTPVLVSGGLSFASVSAGGGFSGGSESYTCGVTTAGSAYCWGASGALGDGTDTDSNTPVRVLH